VRCDIIGQTPLEAQSRTSSLPGRNWSFNPGHCFARRLPLSAVDPDAQPFAWLFGFLALIMAKGLNFGVESAVAALETETMRRVLTEATIESLEDLWDAARGMKPADHVRRIIVPDALVDTGATLLSLPTRLIRQLGLREQYQKPVRSSIGVSEAAVYDAVRLTIQGRTCTMDVIEIPDDIPVLIGQLPLEHLDFVVDLRSRSLIGNPARGGEHMYDRF
jgi:predicted aspartyl protease